MWWNFIFKYILDQTDVIIYFKEIFIEIFQLYVKRKYIIQSEKPDRG